MIPPFRYFLPSQRRNFGWTLFFTGLAVFLFVYSLIGTGINIFLFLIGSILSIIAAFIFSDLSFPRCPYCLCFIEGEHCPNCLTYYPDRSLFPDSFLPPFARLISHSLVKASSTIQGGCEVYLDVSNEGENTTLSLPVKTRFFVSLTYFKEDHDRWGSVELVVSPVHSQLGRKFIRESRGSFREIEEVQFAHGSCLIMSWYSLIMSLPPAEDEMWLLWEKIALACHYRAGQWEVLAGNFEEERVQEYEDIEDWFFNPELFIMEIIRNHSNWRVERVDRRHTNTVSETTPPLEIIPPPWMGDNHSTLNQNTPSLLTKDENVHCPLCRNPRPTDPTHICVHCLRLVQALEEENSELKRRVEERKLTEQNYNLQQLFDTIKYHKERGKLYWAVLLAGEVGELCNYVKKEVRLETDLSEEISLEAADVFISLVLICKFYHINLSTAVVEKLVELENRQSQDPSMNYEISPSVIEEQM